MKKSLRTWQAFLIAIVLITTGFVFQVFFETTHYITFCSTISGLFFAFAGKNMKENIQRNGDNSK